MKKIIIITVLAICISKFSSAQFVATMKIKEPIEGLCNEGLVYTILPGLQAQVEAVCSIKEKEILKKLNAEVQFLKENPDYNGKGMMSLVINCEGVLVKCKMDLKTKSSELDKQIENVFNNLGAWIAGTIDKKKVDTAKLYSFVIKNGLIVFD